MLSGKAIKDRLRPDHPNRLVVWPIFDLESQIKSRDASIDLRLGTRFASAKRRRLTHIDAFEKPSHQTSFVDEYYVSVGDHFVLHPRHFVLATTLEWVRLPADLGAYITAKSTLARMGLNIATAVGIHPFFAGTITLEMANLADVPVTIHVGMPIGQLFFHTVEEPATSDDERTSFVGAKRPLVGNVSLGLIEQCLGIGPSDAGPKKKRRGRRK